MALPQNGTEDDGLSGKPTQETEIYNWLVPSSPSSWCINWEFLTDPFRKERASQVPLVRRTP
jgi:hypothetical protein